MAAEVFKFKPSHIEDFVPQEMQSDEWLSFQELRKCGIDDYLEDGLSTTTLQLGGKTYCIFGWIPLPDDGANGWLFFSNTTGGTEMLYATAYVKATLEMLKSMFDWIQTPVRDDFPQAKRWMRLLGFCKTEHKEEINNAMYTYWARRL